MEQLQLLMSVHSLFVDAAGLPEATRPFNAQGRLETIQKSIMEELEKIQNPIQAASPPSTPHNDDDIPF
jgi:hypothetical protein